MSLSELRSLITRHGRRGSLPIDDVALSVVEEPGTPSAAMTGTLVALIAQGSKHLELGGRAYDYGAGQYLVASLDLPITGHFSEASRAEPALGFGMVLRPTAVAALLAEVEAPKDAAVPSGLAVSDASAELVDAVVRLLRLLDHPRDLPVLAPMIKREILWRLISGEQGATVRQIGFVDSTLSHVSRAAHWIRDHHAEAFRVEDLARSAGMSVSAFHRNFHAVTAMSPIQFQKRIRLQTARTMLVARADDVAGVGYAVGYDSPSQFSREYRRQFGTPPGQDAARLRAEPQTT
ncbi:AraC family transcriptional regulator N-terminal domain-containing protein [Umezawaea sp. NPDC059074]|uniref:AraC family transcriptional regulator n=1 Tax=Umezawaea sp. NPDC059074 TaxID=3346716 RepID=UPI0036C74FD9